MYIYIYIYVVKKTDSVPSGYYQSANSPIVTHALGHMSYRGATGGLVIAGKAHCLSF